MDKCKDLRIGNMECSNDNRDRNNQPTIPAAFGIVFIAILLGIYGTIYLIDDILPTPLTISDEQNNLDSFIAERSQLYLKKLTDIGPRITGGYENEIKTVELLITEINLIKDEAHVNQKIEVDLQIVSGAFIGEQNLIYTYGNIQNVIVKLHSKNYSNHSLLVNAHFDSVPTSPGGSDDGINCATMLEALRKLSQSSERLEHNVIFLFNGAEETPVQASHGFITKHKWAKEVHVLVNLEGAGAGGKVILFQAGPEQPWLLNYYNGVPHPNAQAVAEEMFQSGLIPSGTDFIIFREFGDMVGLDFAFVRNGYRYHTRFDGFSNIPEGSYQYVGDNTLYLIRALANAPELSDPEQTEKATVFYDYLGMFMISYSETIALVLNCIAGILSVVMAVKSFYDLQIGFSKRCLTYLGLTMSVLLLSWISSGILVIVIACIVDALGFSLSWYGSPWILFGLYITPVIVCSCGVIVLLNRSILKKLIKINLSAHTQIQAHLLRLIWTILLLIGTFVGLRSVYLILMPVLFQTLSFFVIHVLGWHRSEQKWQIVYLVGTIIPNLFLMQQSLTIITFLIPICGRIGPFSNPEIIIGMLTFGVTLLIVSVYMPLITPLRKPVILFGILSTVFLIFFIIIFTPVGFPYSGDPKAPAPQRFWVYHASRTFRDENNNIYKKDSGFYIYKYDRNSPDSVKEYVKDLVNVTSIAEDCKRSLYCGLPFGRYSSSKPEEATWIPAEQPTFHEPINLQLESKIITNSVRTFKFIASGPDRLEIYISPKTNFNLTSISLTTELPSEPIIWNDRPLYTILYTGGKNYPPLSFSLQFEAQNGGSESTSTFDIALVGRYLHDNINEKTPHFEQFLSEFPDWTDVAAWLSAYASWVY